MLPCFHVASTIPTGLGACGAFLNSSRSRKIWKTSKLNLETLKVLESHKTAKESFGKAWHWNHRALEKLGVRTLKSLAAARRDARAEPNRPNSRPYAADAPDTPRSASRKRRAVPRTAGRTARPPAAPAACGGGAPAQPGPRRPRRAVRAATARTRPTPSDRCATPAIAAICAARRRTPRTSPAMPARTARIDERDRRRACASRADRRRRRSPRRGGLAAWPRDR